MNGFYGLKRLRGNMPVDMLAHSPYRDTAPPVHGVPRRAPAVPRRPAVLHGRASEDRAVRMGTRLYHA
jgi:hypothetical protein